VTDELITDARAGKPHAAPFLISLYGPPLAGYLRDIAYDLSDTDRELIAERAVEAAVRKIDRYDSTRGPFTVWLRAFARHEVLNWRRATARLHSLDEVDVPNPGPPDHRDPPDPVLAAVTDALRALSDADQVIIALRDIEQLPSKQAADRLGITDDACRQRYTRARRRLAAAAANDPRLSTYAREASP
jgi:RNA polymerase sigma factor (sigma-70 family)